jgi:hypothetical protein
MRDVSQPGSHDHDMWESLALSALARAEQQSDRLVADYGLGGDVQYHWSLDDARIVWSRAGREFLRARITMIATVNTVQRTWLWAWANRTMPPSVLGDIDSVRRYGVEHHFPLLARAGFQADPKPVNQARVVAGYLLGADGLWRDLSGDMEIHFAFHDLVRSQP